MPWNYVVPSYFDVPGMPLVAGRMFRVDDVDSAPVAIVSEAMARRYWGRTDVVGDTYRAENAPDTPIEIVGVAGNVVVRSLGETPRPAVCYPTSGALGYPNYVVRTSGEPERALGPIRAASAEVDDRILVVDGAPMGRHLGATLEVQRLAGIILGALGGLALVLAMLGLYGVVSYAVSRRRHEVGIRIALGAGRESVIRLFVRDVGYVVLVGGAIGVTLSVPSSRLVGQLFTGSPGTPWAVAAAAALLFSTALLATVVPATRAARTDPTSALRQE